jgi:MerR family transcriptional regulator, mercuric resistance operon regulatory protein
MGRSQRDFSIGGLARATGVNLETIRYYERIGLMAEPGRTGGGHRVYGEAHLRRLAFIRRARELGFGLGDIRALLGLSEDSAAPCEAVQAIAAEHLTTVRAKIADLLKLQTILEGAVSRCGRQPAPNCAVLEMLDGETARAGLP